MKKTFFGFIGLMMISMVLVMACKSAPSAGSASPPAGQSSAEYDQEAADADAGRVYDAYQSKIIREGEKPYTVVRGDTLSKIAIANYGGANHRGYFFPLIMMASDMNALNPDLIQPGMKLVIPDLQRNLADPDAKAAIKAFLLEIADIYQRLNGPYSALTETNLRALSNSL